jgi:hypothetical protein
LASRGRGRSCCALPAAIRPVTSLLHPSATRSKLSLPSERRCRNTRAEQDWDADSFSGISRFPHASPRLGRLRRPAFSPPGVLQPRPLHRPHHPAGLAAGSPAVHTEFQPRQFLRTSGGSPARSSSPATPPARRTVCAAERLKTGFPRLQGHHPPGRTGRAGRTGHPPARARKQPHPFFENILEHCPNSSVY